MYPPQRSWIASVLLLLPAGYLGELDPFTGRHLKLACDLAKPALENLLAAICLNSKPCELTSQFLVAFAVKIFFSSGPWSFNSLMNASPESFCSLRALFCGDPRWPRLFRRQTTSIYTL
jgi:hypothetical protein